MTIVQLSDIHVGPTIHRDFIETIVRQTNALNPDLIAITGDLVDGSVEDLAEHVAPLAQLRAKHGVFFVTGNHEYYSGAEEWCTELRRLGVRVLRNERVSIGEPSDSFDLAGTDDHSAKGFGEGHGEDLPKALGGRDPARELVLLAHQPKTILQAQHHGVGLQLSGHTHGGQIWLGPTSFAYNNRSWRAWPSSVAPWSTSAAALAMGTADAARCTSGDHPARVARTRLVVRKNPRVRRSRVATRMPSSAALTMPPA